MRLATFFPRCARRVRKESKRREDLVSMMFINMMILGSWQGTDSRRRDQSKQGWKGVRYLFDAITATTLTLRTATSILILLLGP